MKGIILAGGSGTRLWPITKGVSKQLMPVYDKPMIYYPLATLIEAKIKDILVITTPYDQENFKRLLDGIEVTGINLKFATQPRPEGLAQAFIIAKEENFINDTEAVTMILGDNIFVGEGMKGKLALGINNASEDNANIFCYEVTKEEAKSLGIAVLDQENKVLEIEEKPNEPKATNCVTGLYMYGKNATINATKLTPSPRGELEITDLNKIYLEKNKLKATILSKTNYEWIDTGKFYDLNKASNKIKQLQDKYDTLFGSPEKEAYLNGWMSETELEKAAKIYSKNSYGKRLQKLL